MSNGSRRHFTPQQKAEVVRRHLTGKEAVSELASEFQVQPSQIHGWVKLLLDQAEAAFQRQPGNRRGDEAKDRRIAQLERHECLVECRRVGGEGECGSEDRSEPCRVDGRPGLNRGGRFRPHPHCLPAAGRKSSDRVQRIGRQRASSGTRFMGLADQGHPCDAKALQRFEREIARVLAAAIRDAGPVR